LDAPPAPVSADPLLASVERVRQRITADDYSGYDPYDALVAPVFRVPGIRSSKTVRFGSQQLLKRVPFNIRPALGIKKGRNPVTLALALDAYARLSTLDAEGGWLRHEADRLVGDLVRMARETPHGIGWGYDFPWQTRFEFFPAHTPTIVATGIVTNALVSAYETFGDERALDLVTRAAGFVAEDLPRIEEPDGSFCWTYSPLDRQPVLNATAKGGRLLAQVSALANRPELAAVAERTFRYVAAHQRDDGSWPYSVGDGRTWSDNFHTGYVLDSLLEYAKRTDDGAFDETRQRGWTYYRGHFFENGVVPKYYDNNLYPIDATSIGQSLITLTRYGDASTARAAATWAIDNMLREDGAFAYRRLRRYTIRIPYMRWSTAWMFCGLAHVAAAS
jgi:hypothetical protein